MRFPQAFSTTLFASLLSLSLITACDDGDDGTDEAADNGDGDGTDGTDTTGGGDDVTCAVFCESFITNCLQTGESTEFETNDLCLTACGAWDQAGINCRNEQIGAMMCAEAGNMGTTCN
jgi:hypothetical protein